MFRRSCPDLLTVTILALLFGGAAAIPAAAGPPLLCHPFEIGGARSLPWGDAHSWSAALSTYQLAHLVPDTEALLGSPTPVIVRMETLRRAAIYAGRDANVAARLFASLVGRAERAEQSGKADPLAMLDAAYFTEALRQASRFGGSTAFGEQAPLLAAIVRGSDGYLLAEKAVALRPGDAAVEFAAALIAVDRRPDAYSRHAEKARAGARGDRLLAANIGQVREPRPLP